DYAPVEVFVGPPGVGKTTTIAKIAAQEHAAGGRRFGLVSADAFRIGGVEQLRTYAQVLDTPLHAVRGAGDLKRALCRGSQAARLVDTGGRSPYDPGARELFRVLSIVPGVRTHLVIPASTTVSAARRIIDAYADARPGRLVLTKVDEAESL